MVSVGTRSILNVLVKMPSEINLVFDKDENTPKVADGERSPVCLEVGDR